jgi:hypothetical protein
MKVSLRLDRRTLYAAGATLATAVLAGIIVLAAAGSSPSVAATRAAPTPPATVTADLIARVPGTVRPGTVVGSGKLGHRVFVDAKHGFALAALRSGDYPAVTVNGGQTWKVKGPVLHLNAAQAPLVVTQVGAASKKKLFAYGGPGGGQSVDVTPDGGKHWYRALLGDAVMAVVAGPDGRLVAFAQVSSGSGSTALTWVYVSRDGGRTWHYSDTLGAF